MSRDPLDEGYAGNAQRNMQRATNALLKGDTYTFHFNIGEALKAYALAVHWGREEAEGRIKYPS